MNSTVLLLLLVALLASLLIWRSSVAFVRRWAPVFELIFALVAFGFMAAALASDGRGPGLAVAALALIAVVLGRDSVRDYLAGVRVRAGRIVRVGDALTLDDAEGVVAKVGRLSVTLDDERGAVVVPHSKVATAVLRQRTQRTGARPHTFEVEWTSDMGQPRAARLIEHAALLDPLCAAGREVRIEPIGPKKIAVTVHALASTHAYAVEATIREVLEAGIPPTATETD